MNTYHLAFTPLKHFGQVIYILATQPTLTCFNIFVIIKIYKMVVQDIQKLNFKINLILKNVLIFLNFFFYIDYFIREIKMESLFLIIYFFELIVIFYKYDSFNR